MNPFERLGPALALLRHRTGLRQMDVAERAQATPAMISEYESGKRVPHLENLGRVLKVLGADVHDLANALRAAEREASSEQAGGPEMDDPYAHARLRASRALGDLTTAFDTLTRSMEDLISPPAGEVEASDSEGREN